MQIQEKQKENWIFFLKACIFIKNERKWELKFPGMFSLFLGVSDLWPKVDSEFQEFPSFWGKKVELCPRDQLGLDAPVLNGILILGDLI
jgi:hypothetical protein